jgi:hypothetical protein
MIAQLACNAVKLAPTSLPPTSAAAPQSTEAAPTSTGEHATPVEAQAMLNQAVQHYQAAGREQALKDFNEKNPPFADRDLYVVCLGSDHKLTAFGAFPLLVGTSADSIQGPSGQPLGQIVWDAASSEPRGSVPFQWDNPLTGQPESKILFYQKLDQDICGVAANNP